jgi:quinol monooxygenase YgiN
MNDQVSWVLEVDVKPGQLDRFRALMDEMVARTSEEETTLGYEWFISDDGGTVHVYEKYADSDAMVAHVRGFLANWATPLLEIVEVTRFTVYGDPSAEARTLLDGFGARYLGPLGGFSRTGAMVPTATG